ncbi:MAG: hypothetical protein LBC46_02385 [Treponema sp.]|jgi:hypothetical protein|nr:hypothetical protein [Treponema sp.]
MLNKNRLINLGTMPFGALFMVLAISCETYKWEGITYRGEDTPVLAGTLWGYRDSDGDTRRIVFLLGGGMKLNDASYTWERRDTTVRFVSSYGYFYMEGAYNPETKSIIGNGQNSYGKTWTFTMELLPGSSPPGNLVSGAGTDGVSNAP